MTTACAVTDPGLADGRVETADAQPVANVDAAVSSTDAAVGASLGIDATIDPVDAGSQPQPDAATARTNDAGLAAGTIDAGSEKPTVDAAPVTLTADAALAVPDAAIASIDAASAPHHAAVIKTLSVPGGPFGMASDGTNMWVACQIGNTVDKFDLATQTLQDTIAGDGSPFDVASIDSTLWVVDNFPGAVSRIDETNDSVVATISVPANRYPTGFAFDGTFIWVPDNYGDNVLKIDPSTNAIVDSIAIGAESWGVVFDGSHIWASAYGSNYVAEIDPATDAVIANVTVSTYPMFLAFDGTDVWVSGFISDTLDRIDPATGTVVASIPFGGGIYNIMSANGFIWLTTLNGSVLKIDPATNATVDSVAVPNPYGIAFDGTNVWVSSRDQNLITIIAP